ncbi:hypothetical protein D910_08246 [Dendroctonus ponderosae]
MGAFVHLLAYNNTEGMNLSKRRVSVEDVEKCTERFGKAKTMNSILRHVTESDELLEELDPKTAWHFEEKYKKNKASACEFYVKSRTRKARSRWQRR